MRSCPRAGCVTPDQAMIKPQSMGPAGGLNTFSSIHLQRSAAASSLPRGALSSSSTRTDDGPCISLQQYDDCELLWLQYGRQLSLSKSAIYWSLQDIQQGKLPCDAELLSQRTAAFAALGQQQQVPGLDAMRVLNSCRHALRHEPQHVRDRLQQLLQLLPGAPATQLLLDTLADLDLPPEILALQHQEADAVFRASLGAHVTPAVLHHSLQHWRRQQRQQEQTAEGQQGQTQAQGAQDSMSEAATQQQRPWPAGRGEKPKPQQTRRAEASAAAAAAAAVAAAAAQQPPAESVEDSSGGGAPESSRPWHTRDGLLEQLSALTEVLGPEVVHAAVCSHPQLLDARPSQVLANLQWLQQELRLSPVAALLLAETAADVLMLPSSVLEARYSNLCYLLLQLLGWRVRQVHTLLCNAPQLLGLDSARLASNWQLVQQLARRRSLWLEELAGASQGLVAAVLGAEQRQLQQLRYAAEARELQGLGLVQVLKKEYVDFLFACPGFRVWRGLVPAEKQRWSLVDVERCRVVVPDEVTPGLPQQQVGRVLAVDRRGQPVLIQLPGELSPSDRLVPW